jgi:hypothetical protein
MDQTPVFFISYASEDRPRVRPVKARLQSDFPGAKFWFDQDELLPGDNWDLKIRKAKDHAKGVIPFLSASSVAKEGYIQKEFKWFTDRAKEMPDGHSFLFPVRLEECEIPYQMMEWQACDLFDGEEAYQRLKLALTARLEQLGVRAPVTGGRPSERRIALIATPEFSLNVFQGVYRECTSKDLPSYSGLYNTLELELEHGKATLLRLDPQDEGYVKLDRQIHMFHPEWIVVLGVALALTIHLGETGQLIIPSQLHSYRLRDALINTVRDFELVMDGSPYTANMQLMHPESLPAAFHKVGAVSTQMDLALLQRQIAATDLDLLALEDADLFRVVSGYTRNWMLLSAVAGPFDFPVPTWAVDSASYAVSKKVMQILV